MNIIIFFENDINKLINEISLFKDDESLWKTQEGILNSAGNLTLHLLGNLNHFIGSALGHTDFIRDRDDEFSLKNVARETLISDLKELQLTIKEILPKLSQEELQQDFPIKIREQVFTTQNMLIYLLSHFNYHLGQVNYLRRML